jgi:hypothetical protein
MPNAPGNGNLRRRDPELNTPVQTRALMHARPRPRVHGCESAARPASGAGGDRQRAAAGEERYVETFSLRLRSLSM